MEFNDITYAVDSGVAWVTINRPQVRNAFRAQTVDGGRRGRPHRSR